MNRKLTTDDRERIQNLQLTLVPFKAVIFDMDGLILDTEPGYRLAWKKAAADMGIQLSDEFFKSLSGCAYERVEATLKNTCGESFSLSYFRELSEKIWWENVEKYGISTKPGYRYLLNRLHLLKIPFCLATNSQRKHAEQCLDLAGIRQDFEILVTRDQVENSKPAPDLYLKASTIIKVPMKECLAVEDSTPGIQSALSAGAIPIMISDEPVLFDLGEKYSFPILESLSDLANLM